MAKMKSGFPAQKVTAGVIAGAVTTIVVWVVKTYWGTQIPGEVGSAITTVFAFAVSYLVPPAERDQVVAG